MLQYVDSLIIKFPTTFNIDQTHIVQTSKVDIANLTRTKNLLVFKLAKFNPVQDATILVDGIINPTSIQNNKIILNASLGSAVKFGPLSSEVIFKDPIPRNAISTSKIVDRAVTAPKINSTMDLKNLFDLEKLLFINCKAKTVAPASSAKVINFEGNGLTPSFGMGTASCEAPDVKEN